MINPKAHPRTPLPTAFPSVMNYRISQWGNGTFATCWIGEKDVNRLQEVSSETEETNEAARHGESLVGAGCWDNWGGGWDWDVGGSSSLGGWHSWCRGGAVSGWVHWGWGGDRGGSVNWLADGAWAVGDGDGGALSQGVGVGAASIGDGCASGADSGVDINDLGGVDNGVVVPSRDGGGGSKDNGGR